MYYCSFLENSNNIVDVSLKLLVLVYQQKTKANKNSFFMIRKVVNKAGFIVFTLEQNTEIFTNCFLSQKYKIQR